MFASRTWVAIDHYGNQYRNFFPPKIGKYKVFWRLWMMLIRVWGPWYLLVRPVLVLRIDEHGTIFVHFRCSPIMLQCATMFLNVFPGDMCQWRSRTSEPSVVTLAAPKNTPITIEYMTRTRGHFVRSTGHCEDICLYIFFISDFRVQKGCFIPMRLEATTLFNVHGLVAVGVLRAPLQDAKFY